MEYKDGIIDRISQSISLLKDNFFALFIPQIAISILGYILYLTVLYFVDLENFFSNKNLILLFIGGVLFIIYLFLQIGVLITTYKSLKDIDEEKSIDLVKNVFYGFENISKSLKICFYLFIYVWLFPIVLFIIGVFILMQNESINYSHFDGLGFPVGLIETIGVIFLPIFAISFFYIMYMGIKTTFFMVNSIDKEDYSYNIFKESIKLTKGNWWRIIGNFVLIYFIISIISGIFNSFLKIPDITKISMFGSYISQTLSISVIFSSIILKITNGILGTFVLVFTYIFYKKLLELKNKNSETI